MRNTMQMRMVGAHADIVLIKLRGFLDTVAAYHLQQTGEELIEDGRYKYIFNLEQLEYISSAGIETFLGMVQKLQNKGQIIFTNIPEKIAKLFELIGTNVYFRSTQTFREAIKELEAL